MKYIKRVTLNEYVYVRNENNIATESGVEADVFSWLLVMRIANLGKEHIIVICICKRYTCQWEAIY